MKESWKNSEERFSLPLPSDGRRWWTVEGKEMRRRSMGLGKAATERRSVGCRTKGSLPVVAMMVTESPCRSKRVAMSRQGIIMSPGLRNGKNTLDYPLTGSGFRSKLTYNSGFFQLAIKTPSRDTAGVVTAFYLSSTTSHHDELDFEFLGNREGKPVTLQTNIFTNGHGNREQRLHLWFDPSDGFHDYKVLWNPYHIVYFVDDIPIRVFKNQTNRGVEYPSQPMQVLASLWNGEDWATNGGKDKINWSEAPFIAQFQDFSVDGCPSDKHSCSSSDFWWNVGMYKELTPAQEIAYQNVKKHLSYDYCSDKQRFKIMSPECNQ